MQGRGQEGRGRIGQKGSDGRERRGGEGGEGRTPSLPQLQICHYTTANAVNLREQYRDMNLTHAGSHR